MPQSADGEERVVISSIAQLEELSGAKVGLARLLTRLMIGSWAGGRGEQGIRAQRPRSPVQPWSG